MTTDTDLTRLLEAWLDDGPSVMPDRVPAVVGDRIRRQAQRRPRRPYGMPTMNVLLKVAAAAALVTAMAAGAILVVGGRDATPPPHVAPSASPTSAATNVPSATAPATTVPSTAASAAEEALRSTWTSAADPIPELGVAGPRIGLVINTAGSSAWIVPADASSTAATSTLRATGPDELTASLDRGVPGCTTGDLGHYRWSQTADRLQLTLSALEDPCVARRDALERTWTRSHMGAGSGGAGVIDVFDPVVQLTLPAATWTATSYVDVAALSSSDLAVFAMLDPQGFTRPCTSTGGSRLEIPHGLDAFEAYIRGLPGFTVEATDETVGGLPARHLDITTVPTTDCPLGTQIVEVQAKADPGGQYWILGAGDPDSMDIVELADRMVLLQLIPQTSAPFDARPVLDSVRFLDATSPEASPVP